MPVFLAALTNLSAGIPLLWSRTQPFFEIGVFMIIMSLVSYFIATVIFPALMFTVYSVVPKKLR